ncbi:unnamed protein product [Ascophyllum nodosum]
MDSSKQDAVASVVSNPSLLAGQDDGHDKGNMNQPDGISSEAVALEDIEKPDGISVEVMTLDDIQTMLVWARDEGWNPGNGDAESIFAADEKGFFMAKSTSGDPIASVSGVKYGDSYGFVGFYICVPEHRGKGYGKFTFGYAIRHLEGRVIGLDALEAQRSNYAKWGFVVAHENIRFAGVVDLGALPPSPLSTGEADERVVVEDVKQNYVAAVLDFDEKHVPAPRERFVRAWLSAPGHVARVAIIGKEVKGYGVLRPSCDGSRIGPLFAQSDDLAHLLIRALVAGSSRETKVYIDVPAPNQSSIELVGRLGLTKQWTAYRMYRGLAPELPLEHIYGKTTLEVG